MKLTSTIDQKTIQVLFKRKFLLKRTSPFQKDGESMTSRPFSVWWRSVRARSNRFN